MILYSSQALQHLRNGLRRNDTTILLLPSCRDGCLRAITWPTPVHIPGFNVTMKYMHEYSLRTSCAWRKCRPFHLAYDCLMGTLIWPTSQANLFLTDSQIRSRPCNKFEVALGRKAWIAVGVRGPPSGKECWRSLGVTFRVQLPLCRSSANFNYIKYFHWIFACESQYIWRCSIAEHVAFTKSIPISHLLRTANHCS